jgi:hypothetical protein
LPISWQTKNADPVEHADSHERQEQAQTNTSKDLADIHSSIQLTYRQAKIQKDANLDPSIKADPGVDLT